MNERKIQFVLCVNDDTYADECEHYINRLYLPDTPPLAESGTHQGYTLEVQRVYGAQSMTSGYNSAIRQSDAKYRVYLHQDVFIVNRNFIPDILDIFKDSSIGMIGMVGSPALPDCGIMWEGPRVGSLYSCNITRASLCRFEGSPGRYCQVEAIDGLLMATQYDLPWREDLFDGWDFYDISQSQEFLKKGYQVVVPYQEIPWVIHDDGFLNMVNYYKYRKVFLNEYQSR